MTSDHHQPAAIGEHRRSRLRSLLLPLCVSLVTVMAGAAVAAPSGTREAGRLDSSLTQIMRLAGRRVRPAAQRLAQGLSGDAERLRALREPASTTQDQEKIALDELRQMSAPATLDPHYAPALVAAGRAFIASSGQDPLTGTAINAEYPGLANALAASEARLASAAGEAAKLSARVGRLTRALNRSKRRAHRLARLLGRGGAAARRRR